MFSHPYPLLITTIYVVSNKKFKNVHVLRQKLHFINNNLPYTTNYSTYHPNIFDLRYLQFHNVLCYHFLGPNLSKYSFKCFTVSSINLCFTSFGTSLLASAATASIKSSGVTFADGFLSSWKQNSYIESGKKETYKLFQLLRT